MHTSVDIAVTHDELLDKAAVVERLKERVRLMGATNQSPDIEERVSRAAELKIVTDMLWRAEKAYQEAFSRYP